MANDVARRQSKQIATNISADLKKILIKRINNLSSSEVNSIEKDLSDLILSLIIRRVIDGYDINSQKFQSVKKTYNKKRAFKNVRGGKTKYASSSKSDHLRLSGQLLSSIYVKDLVIGITEQRMSISVTIDVKGSKNKKKVEGLASNRTSRGSKTKSRREFLGLATSGTYKQRETNEIYLFILQWLNKNGIEAK
jgi:hypothetical protein